MAAYNEVRKHISHLDKDRELYPDFAKAESLIRSGALLNAAEAAVGPLS
jgi:histidine ammonia-lyase